MKNIKILDCTLRDGGYVNNWDFGYENIKKIIAELVNSKIEYIECGFFKKEKYKSDKSLFNSFEQLENLLPKSSNNTKFTLMINYGDFLNNEIPLNKSKNIALRIVFKKEKRYEALEFCKNLKEKNYEIFINPMNTINYNSSELLELIEKINQIAPNVFTIVDTNGEMKNKDILSLFYLIENNLNPKIALGFHSHNSLQLSFSNAKTLLNQNTKRNLIIDSTIFGMGRGAGNLQSEVLTQYLNDNYNKSYNIISILKIIEEQINPIFTKKPWGYSVPYYLAATNSCHPNYATYLIKKQTLSLEKINTILKNIPENKKTNYDKELIKKLYIESLNAQ